MFLETNQHADAAGRAAALSAKYEGLEAKALLEKVLFEEFPGRTALVSSFGTEAAVLIHLVADVDPKTPIVFLDTYKHFPETIAYRDRLIDRLGLEDVRIVTPTPHHLAADDPTGELYRSNTDLCCHIRKTLPMVRALNGFSCWITGRKRFQAETRTNLDLFETQDRWLKVNPLADWDKDMIDTYFEVQKLPRHPLESQGYPSIGCAVCTSKVEAGEDPRSGRWKGQGKTECGIHFVDGKIVRTNAN